MYKNYIAYFLKIMERPLKTLTTNNAIIGCILLVVKHLVVPTYRICIKYDKKYN